MPVTYGHSSAYIVFHWSHYFFHIFPKRCPKRFNWGQELTEPSSVPHHDKHAPNVIKFIFYVFIHGTRMEYTNENVSHCMSCFNWVDSSEFKQTFQTNRFWCWNNSLYSVLLLKFVAHNSIFFLSLSSPLFTFIYLHLLWAVDLW